MQATTTTFVDRFTFPLNVEDASLDADYRVDRSPSWDGQVGIRLWRGLGVAVGVSYFEDEAGARVQASLPHPFFFNRDRSIAGDASSLTRSELAIHVPVEWTLPLSGRLDLTVSGGPSVVRVKQRLVQGVEFSETFPFDQATYTGVTTDVSRDTGVGFNLGGEGRVRLTAHLVGVFGARFSRGRVDLRAADRRTVDLDAGGLRLGAGVGVRFW